MDFILQMLIDNPIVSGEVLCEKLGITRAGVWKRMEKLRELGYHIEAQGRTGYSLRLQPNGLLPAEIKKTLQTKKMGQGDIQYAFTMDSTNTTAKEMGASGAPHGSVAVCAHQSQGKGRLGRSWEDEAHASLLHSLLLRPQLPLEKVQLCTLASALSMAKAINVLYEAPVASIKWPNDIIVQKKKCAGILSEIVADMDGISFVVVGVGVNVNQHTFPTELEEKAISLCMIDTKPAPCLRNLLCTYLLQMEHTLEQLEKGDMQGFLQEYKAHSCTIGNEVMVCETKGSWQGKAVDIDETGALLVVMQDEQTRRVLAGDVSVRGLLGYV